MPATAKIVRTADAEQRSLGALSARQHFTGGEDGLPVLTGIQISQPG